MTPPSDLKLFHYSASPIQRLHGTGYAQLKGQVKPVGLWVSVGRDWRRWCERNEFHQDRLTYEHCIRVYRDGVLLLRSAADLDVFTRQFSTSDPMHNLRCIAWDNVARYYHGICIAPYIWERRLEPHTFWYYPWDCASACIWDFAAIKCIEVKP